MTRWPTTQRIESYMLKAAREAKVHTSWLSINADYEDALDAFVARCAPGQPFLGRSASANRAVRVVRVAQQPVDGAVEIRFTRGAGHLPRHENRSTRLVDPDNRHPVDYARRRELVDGLTAAHGTPTAPAHLHALLASPYDGRAKLWVILRALALRRAHPDLFAYGDYRPIPASGANADHVVAFARTHGAQGIVAVAGRLFLQQGLQAGTWPVGEFWQDTALALPFIAAGSIVTDVLSGEALATEGGGQWPLARLCRNFPLALLHFVPAAASPA